METNEQFSILLVEDEEDVRFMMCEMLEFMNFQVDVANSAEEAISMSQLKPYHYYLVDIVMPGKTGLEALTEMKIQNIESSVVIVSANINHVNLKSAKDLGVTKFLPKPIKMYDLESMLGVSHAS